MLFLFDAFEAQRFHNISPDGTIPFVFAPCICVPSHEGGHKGPPIHMIPYIVVISNRIEQYNVVILVLGCAHVYTQHFLASIFGGQSS